MAKLPRRLARLAGFLAGLILLGLAALHLPSVRARVLDRARGYAERELGIALRASSLGYNLFTQTLELRDLSLASTSADQPFLTADRLVVSFGPEIVLGRSAIRRISLSRPRLDLVRYADGSLNLPVSKTTASPQQSPLQLGTVSVTSMSARFDDRTAQRSFAIGPLDLSVDTASASNQPGAFGPGEFTLRAPPVEMSGTVAGRVAFNGARVRIEELTADTRQGRIAVAGWADVVGDRPAVSAHVTATINLPQVTRLANLDARELDGHVDVTADVSGLIAAPAVVFAITGRDVRYTPIGAIQLTGRSSLNGSLAAIDTLDVVSPAGSLHVDGGIDLDTTEMRATAPASRLAFRWSDIHVDSLVRAFGPSSPVRFGSFAEGSAKLDFDLRDVEARQWSRVRASATTSLRPSEDASGSDVLAVAGNAAMRIDEGRWSLRHSIEARTTRADLSGELNGLLSADREVDSTLRGRSRLRVLDIGALPPLIRAAGVKVSPDVADGLAGDATANVEFGGTIRNPSAGIELAGRDLRARMLRRSTAVDAQLAIDATAVRANEVRATSGTTSMQASGTYSWNGRFAGRIEAIEGNLSEFGSHFQLPLAVSGSVRLEATISGADGVGQAAVALSARALSVDDVPVGTVTAQGTVMFADGATTTIDATAPNVGGRAHLEIVNSADYPVSGEVALDHDQIGALIPPRYQKEIGDVSGRVAATARGTGRLANPAGIRGRVDLRVLDVMARGTHVALAAPGSITLADDRIRLDSFELRLGERTRAALEGQLGVAVLPQPLRVRVEGPLTEMIDIGSRAAGAEPPPIRSDGTATFDVTVGGTLEHPLPNGTLAVRSESLAYGTMKSATGVTVDAMIDSTVITLRTLAAQWQGTALSAEGILPWRVVLSTMQSSPDPNDPQSSRIAGWLRGLPDEPRRASMTVRADNVTEAVLSDFVASERIQQIQGGTSATVTLEADRLSLDRVDGTVVFDRAWLTLAGVPFTPDVPTRLRIQNGRASIDAFQWSAEGNSITASGSASLVTPSSIDLGVRGILDLRVLSAFVNGIASGGTADADVTVRGSFDDPDLSGRITLADGYFQIDSPRLAAVDVAGTAEIEAGRKATILLNALVNTGNGKLEGTLDLHDLSAPVGKLQFTGRGVAFEYPSGLQTESNVDLELAFSGVTPTLSGRVDVLGGTYREALVLSSQLLNFSTTSGIAGAEPHDDWLSRMRLDIAVATTNDVHIDNNYGRLDIGAAFRVVGTVANPGVLGRLQASDDGEIYLGGNTYRIERLAIDLTNPRGITPAVTFSAQTKSGDLPIGIELQCPAAGPCERKITSLASNVDDKEAEARLLGTSGGTAAAGENVARLLSGELLGVVGRSVGLDAVRLEQGAARRDIFDDPTLISGDVNPAARLTLAKRLGSNVELVFSHNLADDGFTWITSYVGPLGLSGRLLVFDDQSRSYEFRHEPEFGAGRSRRQTRPPGPRITAVRIAGTPGFPEKELREKLRLKEGDRFSFGDWQRDRDRLARFYREHGLFEARIRARRLPADAAGRGDVQLEYTIARGLATDVIIRGATLPEAVRERIVGRWASALFDGFLERDARAIVQEHLYREGHLHATVSARVAVDASRTRKTLTVETAPGPVVPSRIDVSGNASVSSEQVLDVVRTGGVLAAWLDPRAVERLLENHYRSQGFLAVDVTVGAPLDRDGTSVVSIEVAEGAPYSIGRVELTGVPDALAQEARDALALAPDERYRPLAVAEAVDRLEARLRQASYLEARVDVQTVVDAGAARVDVSARVTPGLRSIVRDVVVQGGDASTPLVARAITVESNVPLDPAALVQTRQRLYDLDVYRRVDIDVQPLASTPAAQPAPGETTGDQAVVARIELEERPRYRLRYGLAISDEVVGPDERDQHLGVAADFENRNIFGRGASLGFSLRLRSDQQVGRVTLGAKRFFTLPIRSTVFAERKREQQNPEGALPITSDVTSLTGEQAYRFWRAIEWRYGYGIERNHTFIRSDDSNPFDLSVRIARFTTSGLADRRDDAFNPTRGWFTASTLEVSKPGIGSDLNFLKDFAQFLHFVPFRRGLVLASAARLGLARTFEDEVLIPSERFYAGGANSVRGYREDDLGARSVLGGAEGGSALLVLNGELRFPVYRWLKGAGFIDLGNVYPKVSDISFTELQIGFGAGARVDTPFGLIRLDLGVPANRRPFDPRWRIHVGLGQAF